jgi:phosphoglycerol transferase
MKKKSKSISSAISVILLIITSVTYSIAVYINGTFDENIEEMIFYLFNGVESTSMDVVLSAVEGSLFPFIFVFIILYLPIMRLKKREHSLEFQLRKRTTKVSMFPIKSIYKFRLLYASFMLLVSIVTCFYLVGFSDYIKRLLDYSSIFEEYYVSPSDVSITFPEEKRNLIILYLESLENTMIEVERGGGWSYTVIPELERIATENINFSNSDKIGGALPIAGTGWTVAGLVATSSGIPLKIPIHGNDYTSSKNFLSGAYTLGDMLKKEGYNLEVMFGSDASFGGRSSYYKKHGDYEIFDLMSAIVEGKMLETEKTGWGFDDTHLFAWAKEEITELASKEQPFSFSFLTVNTHFPDGYLESGAEDLYKSQYENVHAYSSKQVGEFVSWFQKQEFFDNTTLVILGDHHSMQDPEFYTNRQTEGYKRTIYNTFINSPIEPIQSKNREFTSLDMYPTILASIGVEIEDNRLGLGTNLFSDRQTLVEDLGYNHLNGELTKNSNFYNKNILQGDYLDLLNKAKEKE